MNVGMNTTSNRDIGMGTTSKESNLVQCATVQWTMSKIAAIIVQWETKKLEISKLRKIYVFLFKIFIFFYNIYCQRCFSIRTKFLLQCYLFILQQKPINSVVMGTYRTRTSKVT